MFSDIKFSSRKLIPFSPTSYVKLQDAYVSEAGNQIGDWTKIGYKMANTSVFTYSEPATGFTDNTVALSSGMKDAWVATSLAALNDCGLGSTWAISVEQNGSTGGSAVYVAEVTAASESTAADCKALTPSFEKLDTKS